MPASSSKQKYDDLNVEHEANLSPTRRDIERLAVIADRDAGIVLNPDKGDFLTARLSREIQSLGMGSFLEYCNFLEEASQTDARRRFTESITTHTTSFFRENAQYNWLTDAGLKILWESGAGRDRELIFWSAACSTGPELYTALMVAREMRDKGLAGLRFRGIGTDVSSAVVKQASRAVYMREEIEGIPIELRRKFILSARNNDGRYRIAPDLRQLAEWKQANLVTGEGIGSINADVAFLRNVLIYFDAPTQARVVSNVLSRLRPGGLLLTGHTETSHARQQKLEVIRPTIYRKEQ